MVLAMAYIVAALTSPLFSLMRSYRRRITWPTVYKHHSVCSQMVLYTMDHDFDRALDYSERAIAKFAFLRYDRCSLL